MSNLESIFAYDETDLEFEEELARQAEAQDSYYECLPEKIGK